MALDLPTPAQMLAFSRCLDRYRDTLRTARSRLDGRGFSDRQIFYAELTRAIDSLEKLSGFARNTAPERGVMRYDLAHERCRVEWRRAPVYLDSQDFTGDGDGI